MKENIVIWGAGRLLINRKQYINWGEVLCIVDSNSEKWGEMIEGKEVVSPTVLTKMKYDKVVVFVSGFWDEICMRLTEELDVRQNKIQHWSNYLNLYSVQQTLEQILEDAYSKGCVSLLDAKKSLWNNYVYIYSSERVKIEIEDSENEYSLCKVVYEKERKSVAKEQRAIFMGKLSELKQEEWEILSKQYGTVYFTVDYSDVAFAERLLCCFENKNIICEKFDLMYERLYCISEGASKIKIFIAAHKEFTPPQDEMYVPLWLGNSENNRWGYQEDKDIPNISKLNSLINECTGIFWIWKHVEADYVGLVHYRRFFLNDTKTSIYNILRK